MCFCVEPLSRADGSSREVFTQALLQHHHSLCAGTLLSSAALGIRAQSATFPRLVYVCVCVCSVKGEICTVLKSRDLDGDTPLFHWDLEMER